jgi:integrase
MSRAIHRLKAADIAGAVISEGKSRRKLHDGGGLVIVLDRLASGITGAYAEYQYQQDGRRHTLGICALDRFHLSADLKRARERAYELRRDLEDGRDPLAARQAEREQKARERAERVLRKTFAEVFGEYWTLRSPTDLGKNPVHLLQWRKTIQQYVIPEIGALPVAAIETAHIHALLVKGDFWNTRRETAARVRNRVERILGYSIAAGYRAEPNPARWAGHLKELLGAAKAPQKHHAAVAYADMPGLMTKLAPVEGAVAAALRFLILTAARTGEVRLAKWDDVNFKTKVWTMPTTKSGKEHTVPLPPSALAILQSRPGKRKGYVFSNDGVVPFGNRAMWILLHKLGIKDSVHGFRSSFRDWCGDCTSFPREVAEAALNHALANKVESAYRRASALEKRRRLMDAWAAFLAKPVVKGGDKVVSIGKKKSA